MIYRKLPHGDEKISILGLGANGLAENGDPGEILCTCEMAIERGINLFDLAGENAQPFAPLGCAMKASATGYTCRCISARTTPSANTAGPRT